MQIKTALSHFINRKTGKNKMSNNTKDGGDVKEMGILYSVDESLHWHKHFREQYVKIQ